MLITQDSGSCEFCGVSLAGAIVQAVSCTCDKCSERYSNVCDDCRKTKKCSCGGTIQNQFESKPYNDVLGMQGRRVVLISCVGKKEATKQAAEKLYVSPLFRKNLAYARGLMPDEIFILSAEHGVLPLDKIVEPYNKTLNKMPAKERKEWAVRVLSDLQRRCNLRQDEFIILAGKKYRENLLGVGRLENFKIPMEGLRIGEQLSFLTKNIK